VAVEGQHSAGHYQEENVMTQYLLSATGESADTTTATHQTDASRTWVSQRRRSRTRSVGVAVVSTSAVYLVAAAGGVDFKLTDPGKSKVVHLILPQIIGFTLFFALLGWGALAVLEHYSNRARTGWSVLAAAVLLLSFVPIGVEHATTATKIVLTVIHCCVAVALFPMLRHSPTTRTT
jgi:uncharacterized membrane protein